MQKLIQSGIAWIAGALSLLLVFPAFSMQKVPAALNLVVVAGEGARNHIRQRATQEPVVRVEDENHQPLPGAMVVFTLPTEGATGTFGNGSKTLTVTTGSRGEAKAEGLKMNQIAGEVPIHVTAYYRGLNAQVMIHQASIDPAAPKAGGGNSRGKPVGGAH